MEVGVVEAAERVGVSQHRLRHLIRAGELPARRVAGRWVLDSADVDRYAQGRRPGRPLSPRVAWGLVDLLESGRARGLSAPERSRMRKRLRARPSLDELSRLARRRAQPLYMRATQVRWPGPEPTLRCCMPTTTSRSFAGTHR